jgi:tetratricopeptide (TPR) repeat protein
MQDLQSLEQAKLFFISGLEKLNSNNLSGAEIDFQLSLKFMPNRLSTLINLSIVLIKLKKFENAEKLINNGLIHYPKNKELLMGMVEIYENLINQKPDYAEAYVILGNVFRELNMYDESLAAYNTAIIIKPVLDEGFSNCVNNLTNAKSDLAETYLEYGNILRDLKLIDKALASYERSIQINSNYAEAHSNRGIALKELKRLEEAIASYDRAIEINPNLAEAYSNRGIALRVLKRLDEALASFERAIEINPDYVEAYFNRGNVLKDLNLLDEALASHDRAIKINPNFAEAHYNRGNALIALNCLDEAIVSYDKAIEINPNYAEAFSNRGLTLSEFNRLDEAIANYDKAIEINPTYVQAYYNKSLDLLRCGDFNNGLNLYEFRWKVKELELRNRSFTQPLWLGNENIKDKTILLHAEQGLGDIIQFCRYAKLVKELGAKVLLEVPKTLMSLLNGLEGVDQLIESGNQLPDFDYHCPLMSLPLAFKTDLATIPNTSPYLAAANNKHEKWAQKLGVKSKLLVGLVWSGNPRQKNDHNRSLTLQQLLPYLSDQFEFVSLQKEVRKIDRKVLADSHIRHYEDELSDFTDTAVLCESMDLVISVCTSVAHLAGAIGKTTWVLLPYSPDWRWLLDIENSPWYPSIKIYRQPSRGDWDSVIQRVSQDLIEYSKTWKLRNKS